MKIWQTIILASAFFVTSAHGALQIACANGNTNEMHHTGRMIISWSLTDTLFTDGIYTDMNAAVVNQPTASAHSYFLANFQHLSNQNAVEYSVLTTAPALIEYAATTNLLRVEVRPGWPNGILVWLDGPGQTDVCDGVVNAVP